MTVPLIEPTGYGIAFPIVDNAYSKWSGLALQAFGAAQYYVGKMTDLPITPVTFDATFNPQIALPGFPTITPPTVPSQQLEFNAPPQPGAAPTIDVGTYELAPAPTFTAPMPIYRPPPIPNLEPLTPPGSAPTFIDPVIPAPPDIVLPQVPTLTVFPVPDLPPLSLPTFSATAPAFNVPVPLADFAFSPAQYVDGLLTQVKTTLGSMLTGDFVLPDAVAAALRNRAYESANREESRAIDSAYDEFGARGFEEPPGLLTLRLRELADRAQLARMGINRDVYVQDQQVALENLRFAVSTGVQLEGQLIQLFVTTTQLQFEAARYTFESAIQIFQARIQQYNAQMQAFGIEASVYRDQIYGALAQAQAYAAAMEGLRVRGELNLQQVQVYSAQLQGVGEMVAIYNAQVQAADVTSRVNLNKVQAFGAEVEAFKAQIQAQMAEWDGYKTQIDAQVSAAQFYQTSVNAFGAQVSAWGTGEQVKQRAIGLQLQQGAMTLDVWKTKLALFEEQLKAELARVATVKDAFEAEVDVFKGQAEVASAQGEYDNRRFQLNLTQEQAIVETSMKRAEANFEQMKYITSVMVEIKKTLATVEAQLAASAMNAVNVGAHIQSSDGQNIGWDTSVSFSGSVDDPSY